MKRSLLEILACPMCKNYPLRLHVFEEKEEIVSGILECAGCKRWYPIIDEIPHMLPDEMRDGKEDITFLEKWRNKTPKHILEKGKPYSLKSD
ncbi:MAG: Trm112 family protein [Candidatus Bathyarchaeia archaeon]